MSAIPNSWRRHIVSSGDQVEFVVHSHGLWSWGSFGVLAGVLNFLNLSAHAIRFTFTPPLIGPGSIGAGWSNLAQLSMNEI